MYPPLVPLFTMYALYHTVPHLHMHRAIRYDIHMCVCLYAHVHVRMGWVCVWLVVWMCVCVCVCLMCAYIMCVCVLHVCVVSLCVCVCELCV